MVEGPQKGLAWIADIQCRGELAEYPLLHAARADLLRRDGRADEAALAYSAAIELTTNRTERAYLQRRLGELAR